MARTLRAGGTTALLVALAACGSQPDTSAAEPQIGTITGQLSYPSSYIPKDLLVCAEHISSGEVTCKGGFSGTTYAIDLEAGAYRVWSQTNDMHGYRAFYSEAVPCGLSVECTDHTPIRVEVTGGETRADIDPGDWYDNPGAAG